MSLQWTLIAAFLYAEIVIVLLLLVPFISPKTWNNLFRSRFLRSIGAQSNFYFTLMIVILVLFFLDSIREMRKYGTMRDTEHDHNHIDAETQHSMRMFRAQRNFYIAGFALFLWLVIRRLITLISAQGQLICSNEATLKQAKSASDAAQRLLSSATGPETSENDGNHAREEAQRRCEELEKENNEIREERDKLEKKLAILNEELVRITKDRDAMKTQSENLAKQYDSLCDKVQQLERAQGDKKSE